MAVEFILFCIAIVLYLLGTVAFIASFVSPNEKVTRAGIWVVTGAGLFNGASLVARWISSGHPPLTSIYETLSLFCFFMVLVFFFFNRQHRMKTEVLGTTIMPLITVIMLIASLNYSVAESLSASLNSFWLFIHVPLAILAYALFAVAAIGGILYILKDRPHSEDSKLVRLPELAIIDSIIYRTVVAGFILLTMGIITGSIWAEASWGSYWSWDPKETWSLITWFVYAIYLHMRMVKGWQGKKSAMIVIIGFIAVIFTYFGVNYIGGLHSY